MIDFKAFLLDNLLTTALAILSVVGSIVTIIEAIKEVYREEAWRKKAKLFLMLSAGGAIKNIIEFTRLHNHPIMQAG